jgi:glycine dehydrogenase subunit 1
MEVANASLYDGAAATVEAVNLGVAATGRQTVWVSRGLNPTWREVLATFGAGTGHRLVDVPLSDGTTQWPGEPPGDEPPGVVVVAYPNFLGCLEDLAAARAVCDRTGALLVVAFDPIAAGVLRPPSHWGPTWWWGRGRPWACPWASAVPTSASSPAG